MWKQAGGGSGRHQQAASRHGLGINGEVTGRGEFPSLFAADGEKRGSVCCWATLNYVCCWATKSALLLLKLAIVFVVWMDNSDDVHFRCFIICKTKINKSTLERENIAIAVEW
jgi:hypothetical protein